MTFSPDGSHFMFVTSEPWAVTVATVDGSAVVRTYSDPSHAIDRNSVVAWPEPGRLLFTSRSPESGFCSVREIVIDRDGHALAPPRELWRTRASGLKGLSFVDGRMSVIVLTERHDIRVADLAARGRRLQGSPRRFTRSEAANAGPEWLPDGRLSFFSDRDSQTALYAQTRENAEPAVLVPPTVLGALHEVLRTGELIYARPDVAADAMRTVVGTPGGTEHEIDRRKNGAGYACIRCGGGDPKQCMLGTWNQSGTTLAHIDIATGQVDPAFFRGGCACKGASPWGASPRRPVPSGRKPKVTASPRGGVESNWR